MDALLPVLAKLLLVVEMSKRQANIVGKNDGYHQIAASQIKILSANSVIKDIDFCLSQVQESPWSE